MDKKPLILQLNFPFCFHKCSYCSESVCEYDTKALRAYADAMVKELECDAEDMAGDYEITAVSIEGGSPGLMLPADLQKVLHAALAGFGIRKGTFISIQTMPGDYSRSLLDRMRDNGVNHYIFGIPTTKDTLHFLLERPYELDTITMADTAIRNFKVRDLSFDLLYGIPGQTGKEFLSDLRRMLEYRPEHMTLYPLRLDPGTALYQKIQAGQVPAPDPEAAAAMGAEAAELLKDCGYQPYTIYDYALPGHENLYKKQQLQGVEQLGVGYHARTVMEDAVYDNGHSLTEYLEFPDRIDILANHLAAPDEKSRLLRHMAAGLTLSEGLPVEECRGTAAETYLQKLTAEGKVSVKEGHYCLTPYGIALAQTIWAGLQDSLFR